MRVLLLGGGGREHALGWKLAQSPQLDALVSCPGNPGLATLGDVVPDVDILDPHQIVALSIDRQIDLVVIGPEGPLAHGVADLLADNDIAVFGPRAAAAQLEASKSFAKNVMLAAEVPTARSWTFTSREEAVHHLEASRGPYVVKADGLAAGKGVLVTESLEDAVAWAEDCLGGRFGSAGQSVVIEEHLDGEELSIFYVCSQGRAIPFQPARDYKRLSDDDIGPNTGGMGSYSPVEDLEHGLVAWTTDRVVLPTLRELEKRDIAYTGFLYVGLMLTSSGPKVLEFNCRLGDPETEVLMPLISSDLLELLHAAATGTLDTHTVRFSDRAAVDVVLAAERYPDSPVLGATITGVSECQEAVVFHAGTEFSEGELTVAGGRVLNVVGLGPTVRDARDNAYDCVRRIEFDGMQFRTDVAADRKGT